MKKGKKGSGTALALGGAAVAAVAAFVVWQQQNGGTFTLPTSGSTTPAAPAAAAPAASLFGVDYSRYYGGLLGTVVRSGGGTSTPTLSSDPSTLSSNGADVPVGYLGTSYAQKYGNY